MKATNGVRLTALMVLAALSLSATSSTLEGKSAPPGKPAAARVKLDPGIQALYLKFSSAFAARDINALMATFDKSVTLSYQGSPDSNWEEIRTGFLYDFKNDPPGTTWTGIPEESHQEGNLAIVIAHWENHVLKSNGEKLRRQRIRSLDVLRRANGEWKVVRTVNYPEDQ
jgi:ketosteroid isomerase-like protein